MDAFFFFFFFWIFRFDISVMDKFKTPQQQHMLYKFDLDKSLSLL